MSARPKYSVVIALLVSSLAPLAFPERASAQNSHRQQRLASIQQQNALQQQQNAVQSALQQTTALLQFSTVPTSTNSSFGWSNVINLQQQQAALQNAVQQTNALLQNSYRSNPAISELALRQLNTLQTVLQQTVNMQGSLPTQNGQLTSYQLQSLVQEQGSLMGLLTAQVPPSSKGMYRK